MEKLDFSKIEASEEIQQWLRQFSVINALTARFLLCNLAFVSRDEYSNWLIRELKSFSNRTCAIYAVRKFSETESCLWNKSGDILPRPAATLGSEDLVASVIANANRAFSNPFLDHPSLNDIREGKVNDILLIDDSIGSGKRVADFVKFMTNHPTFMSWWSYGLIKLHVISFAQTRDSVSYILKRVPGSDHGQRKYRKSEKIFFKSKILYDSKKFINRWGENYGKILNLCNVTTKVSPRFRRGFGNVMGNIIFYHSVPNNIPGMLYSNRKGWLPLFPHRSLPDWLINLVEKRFSNVNTITEQSHGVRQHAPLEVLQVLRNIKSGIRTRRGMAKRMDCDDETILELVKKCLEAGLISESMRLTPAGDKLIFGARNVRNDDIVPDYSLYIPSSWCAD